MSNRCFTCKSFKEADKALEYLRCIAEKYGIATVSDVHDILGTLSTYADNSIGWTHDALADARIDCHASFLREDRKYVIVMPEHDWFKKDEPKKDKKKTSVAQMILAKAAICMIFVTLLMSMKMMKTILLNPSV